MFQSKGTLLGLGVFNARVGKSDDVDDVISMLGEIIVILMVIY